MEMRLLRLVHGQTLPGLTETEARQLEQLLQLLECACDLQTEPVTTASDLLARLRAFDGLKGSILEIRRNIQSCQRLAVQDWLRLSYLATFKWTLRDNWDDCYAIILAAYLPLGQEINGVLAMIEEVPFADALKFLERDWDDVVKKPGFELVALTYVRACGLMGVFADSHLYERVAACLAYEMEFLVVILAAACFKVPAIASQVNIGMWTDTQYACMRVLDNFVHLGETAWG